MKRNIVTIGIGCSMLLLVNCKKDKDTIATGNLLGTWTEESSEQRYMRYKNGAFIQEGTEKENVIESPDKVTFNEDSTYKVVRPSGTTRASGTFSYIKSKNWLLLKRSASSIDTVTLVQLTSAKLTIRKTEEETYTSDGATYRDMETETITYKR